MKRPDFRITPIIVCCPLCDSFDTWLVLDRRREEGPEVPYFWNCHECRTFLYAEPGETLEHFLHRVYRLEK